MAQFTIEYSAHKNRKNINKHGISLHRASDFDLLTAVQEMDTSQDYDEERWIALGFIRAKLYVMIYVYRTDSHLRIISLRRASMEEERMYGNH